jgi:hypothetical protein
MVREHGQAIHVTTPFWKWVGVEQLIYPFEYARAIAANSDPTDPTGANSWDRFSSFGYNTVYTRTATVMHDLEERLGKPAMEQAYKHYYALWKFRHPGIADLQAAIAESSGKPEIVAAAFGQQVYSAQKLDDRIDRLSSEEVLPEQGTSVVNGKWTEATKEQVEKSIKDQRDAWEKKNPDAKEGTGPFPFRTVLKLRRTGVIVPETVVVKFADGSSETVVWDDNQRWARYIWVKPVKAVSAEMDPQHQHYLDANILDNSRTIKADGSASRRWASEVAAFAQLYFSAIATL